MGDQIPTQSFFRKHIILPGMKANIRRPTELGPTPTLQKCKRQNQANFGKQKDPLQKYNLKGTVLPRVLQTIAEDMGFITPGSVAS